MSSGKIHSHYCDFLQHLDLDHANTKQVVKDQSRANQAAEAFLKVKKNLQNISFLQKRGNFAY